MIFSEKGAAMDERRAIEKIGHIEELVYQQSKIIAMQNEIIDRQFQLLLNYMTVEEIEQYPLLESMKDVSELRTA